MPKKMNWNQLIIVLSTVSGNDGGGGGGLYLRFKIFIKLEYVQTIIVDV